jgi:dTDP-4-amino-4,6-dideoxygalactose transaminase
MSSFLHLHHCYREVYGYAPGDLTNTEWISDRTISLPLSPKLTDQDIESVVFAVFCLMIAAESQPSYPPPRRSVHRRS